MPPSSHNSRFSNHFAAAARPLSVLGVRAIIVLAVIVAGVGDAPAQSAVLPLWSTRQLRVSEADLALPAVAVLPIGVLRLPKRVKGAEKQLRLARLDPTVLFSDDLLAHAEAANVFVIASAVEGRKPRFEAPSDSWQEFVARGMLNLCLKRGFDGVVLDLPVSVDDAAVVSLVKTIRAVHPEMPLYLGSRIVADAAGAGVYTEFLESESEAWRPKLAKLRADNIPVLAVVKMGPGHTPGVLDATYQALHDLGVTTFVTTVEMDGTALAPLRERSRKVLVLFGWDPLTAEKPVMMPVDTMMAEVLQAPLEWLGYEADYMDVGKYHSLRAAPASYAAVFLDGEIQIPVDREPQVIEWLRQFKQARTPVFFLSEIPFQQGESLMALREIFGFQGELTDVAKPHEVTVTSADEKMMNWETKVVPMEGGFKDLQAPPSARVLLNLRCKDVDDGFVNFTPAFLCSWGGIWLDPYVILRGSQDNSLFFADPYAVLAELLGQRGVLPAPDATTQEGLRLFYSHIDGDGFGSLTNSHGHPFCAELIRDRILKKFPLPVTVSIVQAELEALAGGIEPGWKADLMKHARSIFALPNVNAGSHSFAHPYQWDATDANPGIYTEPFMTLKPDAGYAKVDLEKEIRGSIEFINEHLLPPGKRVEIMLWSGNCRPGVEALRLTDCLGVENMNGGNTIVSRHYPGMVGIAPRVMQWEDELQIHAANQNEFMYANGWNGPFYGGFADVIDTFERTETPRRLKPVNVYYHFYSATSFSSLRALEKIHHWCMEQPLQPITAAEYARIARDCHNVRVFETGPRQWILVSAGHVRTFRFPASLGRPDMAKSLGVTGWSEHEDSLFVHTDGEPVIQLVMKDVNPGGMQPGEADLHLTSSETRLYFTELGPWKLAFKANPLAAKVSKAVLSGLPAGAKCDITIDDQTSTLTADAAGRLLVQLPPGASVIIDAQRSRYAQLR